jgi:hypothetical protein
MNTEGISWALTELESIETRDGASRSRLEGVIAWLEGEQCIAEERAAQRDDSATVQRLKEERDREVYGDHPM